MSIPSYARPLMPQQRQLKTRTCSAEITAHSPVITRVSALFVVQTVLLLLYVALAVCTAVAVQTSDTSWYARALQWWAGLYFVASALHVPVYDTWISGCHVLTSKAEARLVIGRPMHLAMQKGMIASWAICSGVTSALLSLFLMTDKMKRPLEHSSAAGALYFLILLAQLGIAAMVASLSHQLFPRINVSDVVVYISNHEHS